uniref:Signal peptidase complex subunit 2 n=1 Tax=Pseudictyota dubia TaxID=2749911 RepID=A0A7R9Z7Z3_9STRA|mmetsp:Transcript_29230/g.54174  ORF Transcript_29230/g.54174 Transcript_29230/m.54174 type:complete len:265 (+) Transcript_29230:135-929(+)|eukprot:CAMPEP_0197443970 /NCGR_PEP_ID=MMETSP1175-20131217/9577_1 /TAXON_ID=1003142 /ORGANISM="Triceratium dubium, Strain CCMP147" /LENGTH=264 /DNA_ID=CAMNT_0042974685 /DNA_START=99 /DNA_END=893 /DNA_ORIENTATION=-
MAKKKKSTTVTADAVPASESEVKKAQEADEDEEGSEDDASEIELLQVDVGDVVKLKQILDETVAGTFLDKCSLVEDHTVDNIKLSIMALACTFAMVAQFAPLPFPDSRPVLGGCCAAYFVLSGFLQLVTTFWDKDCIMVTKAVEKAKNQKNSDMEKYGLRIRTSLPRFSEFYTVIIEFQKKYGDGENRPYVKETWSVGQFFDVEGMFDEYGLENEIEELYERFEAGKFDNPKDYIDDKISLMLLLGLSNGPVPTPAVSKEKKEQ